MLLQHGKIRNSHSETEPFTIGHSRTRDATPLAFTGLDNRFVRLTVILESATILLVSAATKVTSKGQVTIPEDLRRRIGIKRGTLLTWEVREGALCARPLKGGEMSAARAHLQSRAGTWNEKLSAVELLARTRP